MLPLRLTGMILVAALFFLPPTSATLMQPIDQPDALGPWGLQERTRAGPVPSAPVDLDIARQALFLLPVGDVDLDGTADMLLQTVDLQSGFMVLTVVSGADPQQVIWSLAPNLGSVPDLIGDLDGDGIADLVMGQAIGQLDATVQEAGSAAVATTDAAGAVLFQAVDGASAAGTFGVQLATSTQVTGASAGVLELGQLGLQQVEATTGFVQATGTDALHQVEQTVQTTQAGLLQQLPLDSLTAVEADAVVTVLTATGEVRAQIPLQDPNVLPLLIAAPDLDLDGLADTVLMQVEKVSPAEEVAAVIPVISAYTGAAVDLAWEVTMDPLTGIPVLVPDVGDLNGDGIKELAYHAIEQVPGSEASGTVLTLLDGATGEVMAQVESATGLLVAAPLGGNITAGASADLLLLEGTVDAITSVSAAGADLEAIWTIDIPAGAAPLNLIKDPFTGAVEGLTDLTGDGIPDLAVASGAAIGPLAADLAATVSGDGFTLDVYSGLDGSLLWSTAQDAVLAAQTVPGLAQDAGSAVAMVVGQAGQPLDNGLQTAEEVTLLVRQAADGAGIFALPLLEADVAASLGEGLAFSAELEAAGDLDGDGVTDLLVRLQAVLQDGAEVAVQQVQGHAVAVTEEALDQVYTVSGRTGEILDRQMATSESVSASINASLDADGMLPTGEVEPMEAYQGHAAAAGALESPGAAVWMVFVALAGAAVVLRRRH